MASVLRWFQRLHRFIHWLTTPVRFLVSEIILLLIFVVVACPLACLKSIFGKRRMEFKPERSKASYWKEQPHNEIENMNRQY